jgi:hypothetical protein
MNPLIKKKMKIKNDNACEFYLRNYWEFEIVQSNYFDDSIAFYTNSKWDRETLTDNDVAIFKVKPKKQNENAN